MPTTEALQAFAESEAIANGIPTDYFQRFITQESGWNPHAVSSAGAQGIAQFMPDTSAGHVDPFDPVASIEYAAELLAQYFKRFGNWESAFAAYNAGPGAVSKYGGVPPFPETQNYVDIITGKNIGPNLPTNQRAGGEVLMPIGAGSSSLKRVLIWTSALILLVFGVRLVLK